MKKETANAAVMRLLAETHGGPIDSGLVSRSAGVSVKSACTSITRMGNRGQVFLFRAVAGKLIYVFATEAHCVAYGADQIEADALRRIRERNAQAVAGKNRAIPLAPGVAPNVTIKEPNRLAWASKEADTSRAKFIVCPAPASYSRTWVDPKTRVVDGFLTEWHSKRGQA